MGKKLPAIVMLVALTSALSMGSADAKGGKLRKIGGWVGSTWERNKSVAPVIVGVAIIGGACVISAGAGCTVTVVAPAAAL